MTETVWLVLAAVSAFLGMGWLALSLENHWHQVTHGSHAHNPARPICLQLLGGTGLLVSLTCSLQADHASMAALVWFMLLSVTALSVTLLLSWRPAWLAVLCCRSISVGGVKTRT